MRANWGRDVKRAAIICLGLLLFSTPVPGQHVETASRQPPQFVVELTDGSRLTGNLGVEIMTLRTQLGKIQVPLEKLSRMEFRENHESAMVWMQNGDRLSGNPTSSTFQLRTPRGNLTIPTEYITLLAVVGTSVAGVLPVGVVLYYACDDPNQATDLSGRGHHGVLKGVTLTADRFGKSAAAYHFDGTQRIEVPDHADFNLGRQYNKTFSFWWKGERDVQHKTMISKVTEADRGRGLNFLVLSEEGYYMAYQIDHWAKFGPSLSPDKWNHAVAVKEGVQWRMFHNGKELAVQNSMGWPLDEDLTKPTPLEFGFRSTHPEYGFCGAMDDICVFNRALSSGEIRALYERQQPVP